MTNGGAQRELTEHIKSLKPVNTHSHHYADEFFADFSLEKLIENTYIAPKWSDTVLPKAGDERSVRLFFEKARFKSYFVWLARALEELYDVGRPFSPDTFSLYAGAVSAAYKADPSRHIRVLKNDYQRIILDAYWSPGSNNGYDGFFEPNFRIDCFVYACSPDFADHNANTVKALYGRAFTDLDKYEDFVRGAVRDKLKTCCALKSTLAYDPFGIGFDIGAKKDAAARALKSKEPGERDAAAFRGYIFNVLLDEARKAKKPFQIHTGLGSLYKSNPIEMLHIIKAYEDVSFSLFHAGYPWRDDIAGLLHNCKNVYADLCWLPIISPEAAVSVLKEYVQVSTSDKLSWGCDTITSEESRGALIAMRHTFARAFAELTADGYMTAADAKELLTLILEDNPKRLYGFN